MTDVFGRYGKRPTVGCDAVVFSVMDGKLRVLLIRRGHEPFSGKWALPGGFMEWGESCEQTVARELAEETGLKGLDLEQIGAFSEPGRDPRGTIVSVAYMGMAGPKQVDVKGADDAAEARWFVIDERPELAFDHEKVLQAALKRLKEKNLYGAAPV